MSRKKIAFTGGRVTPTEIAMQLKELALFDFEAFCAMAGVDMVQVTICIERKKGRTLGQIANKLKMARSTVQDRCVKCTDKAHGTA